VNLQRLKAEDLMTNQYKVVDAEETLQRAVHLFNDETDVLFVYEDGSYKGILTERQILRSGLDKASAKVKRLTVPAPRITRNTSLVECARLMVENDVMMLPVFELDELVGVVTVKEVLRAAGETAFGEEKAESFMSPDLIVCSPQDTLFAVLNLFKQYHISRLPVVENSSLQGIVTMHDLVEKSIDADQEAELFSVMDEKEPFFQLRVDSVMTRQVFTVRKDSSVQEVIRVMLENDVSGVVVVDEQGVPVGVITERDLLERIEASRFKEGVNVQVSTKIPLLDKEFLKGELLSFAERHSHKLGEGSIHCHLAAIAVTKSGRPLIQCRLHVRTDKHRLNVRAESFSAMNALQECLDKLKEAIVREKEKEV